MDEHAPVAVKALSPQRLTRPRRAVVGVFAIHAAVAGSLGPRLPAIKEQAGLSDPELGLALAGFAVGLFLGTRLAAWPLRRFGSRPVLRVGAPAFAVLLVGPGAAHSMPLLTAALVALGIAAGLMDVTMNANAVGVERLARRPIMSSIHGVWSAAMLGAAGAAAFAAGIDASPLSHFVAVAVGLGALSIPLSAGLLDDRLASAATDVRSGAVRAIPWSAVAPLGVIGFCSFLAEGAMNDWGAVYVHDALGASTAVAAVAVAGFAFGMTVSRFVADGLSVRFGSVAVVRFGAVAAAIGLILGLLSPIEWGAIAGFAVVGAALAPVVPTVFSAAGNLMGGARSLGWVVTLSYLGGILGPALIGLVASAIGLRIALGIPAAMAGVIVALAGRVRTAGTLSAGARAAPPHAG